MKRYSPFALLIIVLLYMHSFSKVDRRSLQEGMRRLKEERLAGITPEIRDKVTREIDLLEQKKKKFEQKLEELSTLDLSDYEWVNPMVEPKRKLYLIEQRIRERKMYISGGIDQLEPYAWNHGL